MSARKYMREVTNDKDSRYYREPYWLLSELNEPTIEHLHLYTGDESLDTLIYNGISVIALSVLSRKDEDGRFWYNVTSDFGARLWLHRDKATPEDYEDYIAYLESRRDSIQIDIDMVKNRYQ